MRELKKHWRRLLRFCRRHRKLTLAIGIFVALMMLAQFFYPGARLLPGTNIAGRNYSGWNKSDVVTALDAAYADAIIGVYFGDNDKPYQELPPADIGISIGNGRRVSNMDYPWYLRLVPTSLLWYGLIYSNTVPDVNVAEDRLDAYLEKEFGNNCEVKPIDASLEMDGRNLRLIGSSAGGRCRVDEARRALTQIHFDSPSYGRARIAMDAVEPDVRDDDAKRLAATIGGKLLGDLEMSLGDYSGTVTVPADQLASWLEFEVVDKKLTVVISEEKSADFFNNQIAPLVSQAAGVSTITTNNLNDVSRVNGTEGKMVNVKETNLRIAEYLMDARTSVAVAIESVEPTLQYASSFSATSEGIASFIKHFAQTHDGTFGVQLVEIGGQGRAAGYNQNRQYEIDGVGRILVGYGMQNGRENGSMVSDIGGDTACLKNVLSKNDVYCVSAAVFGALKRDREALGLGNTLIYSDNIKSTAADMAWFLAKIYDGSHSMTSTHRDELLDGLRASEPRPGIGSLDTRAVNATGSRNGQYSDVAVLSANHSEFALAIMVDGGKWTDIAELARQLTDFMNR
ncbi:MAG: class A beta-lactamase-related serine hydrolase [Candidatus Nomurabacteria bacterium]|jgi:beta-lactamase class A|nr:class A beta-lactamase-related serine hydrolase [Candidatus Nomurabacteria bacterium]